MIAARACSAICLVIGLGSAMSTPPVSISRKLRPFHSQTSSLRSRVVPCVSCTTAWRGRGQPVHERRLADVREPDDRHGAFELDGGAAHSGGVDAGRTALRVDVREPVEEHVDAPLDLGGRLLVAAAALRQPFEAHRLAERDRARGEVAEPPELRAVDRDRDDRHVLLDATIAAPGCALPGPPELQPRPLDEQADDTAAACRLAHQPHGVAVGLAATDGDRAVPADEPAEPRKAQHLGLRDEADVARRQDAEERDVDPVHVVRGIDDATASPAPDRARRRVRA